ncbi:hypothetical protein BDZ91DRAFT_762689 [Kalaharituber pfeilii]|nr:hypothetical protein BDZ91DRAFT_762689 [Kalaharituber pfeilii]
MSHSQSPRSSETPVASCSAYQSHNEDAATEKPKSPEEASTQNLSQANIPLTAASTPTKNYSDDVQPTHLHQKLAGLSVRPLYSSSSTSTLPDPSSSANSSPSPATSSPLVSSFSPPSNKRAAFLNKHMRSKSSHFPGMMSPPHSPLSSIAPNSPTSRMPLFRTSSLPTVPLYERPAEKKFVPSFGTPSVSTSLRSGMSIPTREDRPSYRLRDRSPSRPRPSSSSSSLYSTSPTGKYSHSPVHHHSPPPPSWAVAEAYPLSVTASPSLTSCSSGPSTPNSIRSRSPSISSLETIPDSPDAEAEALEAERLAEEARTLAAAEEQQQSVGMARSASTPGSERSLRRRSHIGIDGLGGIGSGTLGSLGGLSRVGGMSAEEKKRKRWSVCGAEKRADLELETIWEDRVVAAQSPPQQCVGIVGSTTYEYEKETGLRDGDGEMI